MYLWHWFVELEPTRDVGEGGVGAIRFGEMKAWADLTGRDPQPWEVALIARIDRSRVVISQEP